MHLENIQLNNFKNYQKAHVRFSPDINCIVGKNGSGKTNLLDAIYYLSITKSALTPQDHQCIRHGASYFSVKGQFEHKNKVRTVICSLQPGKKKRVRLDDKPYRKTSEHLGKFPVVLIAPNDTDIIRGTNEERRKFFDAIIAQTNPVYLKDLIQYNYALKQRNRLLKQFMEKDFFDEDLLDSYDLRLTALGNRLWEVRKLFIQEFRPVMKKHYGQLAGAHEPVDLSYTSDFEQDIRALFDTNRQKDLILKRTTVGIHKDEFPFLIDDQPIRKFGSQGQQKSYLIALKLAHFDYIQAKTGIRPLLLLDDIFDKLDDHRIEQLIAMIASDTFGQIFVTDARPERSLGILENIDHEIKVFAIKEGKLEVLETD